MLKLTHGRRIDVRVSMSEARWGAPAEALVERVVRIRARYASTFSYWELRALTSARESDGGDFSERFPRPRTLGADWIFRGVDSMKGPRVRLTGLPARSNSV